MSQTQPVTKLTKLDIFMKKLEEITNKLDPETAEIAKELRRRIEGEGLIEMDKLIKLVGTEVWRLIPFTVRSIISFKQHVRNKDMVWMTEVRNERVHVLKQIFEFYPTDPYDP